MYCESHPLNLIYVCLAAAGKRTLSSCVPGELSTSAPPMQATHWYIVHETLTHIQVHASPATDITLSFHIHWFSQFYFTRFACTVSPSSGAFCNYHMLCFTAMGGAIRCQCCSLGQRGFWDTEWLLHHEWYNSQMRYSLRHSDLISTGWVCKDKLLGFQ